MKKNLEKRNNFEIKKKNQKIIIYFFIQKKFFTLNIVSHDEFFDLYLSHFNFNCFLVLITFIEISIDTYK